MLRVPQARAEVTHRVSSLPRCHRWVYLGRTVLTVCLRQQTPLVPATPAVWDEHGSRNPTCWDFPKLFHSGQSLSSRPHSLCLQTSCRPTPSQTEDFSYIIFLALLPPASPQAKKFFYQWEAESSFKNREILSRQAQGRHGRRRGNGQPAFTAGKGTPPEAKAGREIS